MKFGTYLTTAISVSLLASCASVERDTGPAPITSKNAKFLEKAMKGRVAGEPVKCVPSFAGRNFTPVSDDLIIYRSGSVVYQNKLDRRCSGLGRGDDILVFERSGISQYCKGDTFKLADRTTGGTAGFCRLGEFVPYRKVKD